MESKDTKSEKSYAECLLKYLSEKFSPETQTKLLKRFLIEAQGEFAAYTPGNKCKQTEHESYPLNNLIKAISTYTPWYQKKLLARYIREILPQKALEYDEAEDGAFFEVMFGELDRALLVRDCINSLHRIPTEELESIKWHLQTKEEEI